jgi:hypothetical protein
MSHRLVRVAALAAIVALGTAGTAAAQGIGIGVKGGLVYPDFSTDFEDYKNRVGWQAGLWIGGNRDGIVGVMGEFNFLRKRAETNQGEVDLSYIQIPVLLRLNTPSTSKNGFQAYGIVGPSFDVKVGESLEGINLIDEFEGMDIGLMFGGGFEIARIIVEGRYTRGMRQVNESFNDVADLKTHSFAVLFGIRFN